MKKRLMAGLLIVNLLCCSCGMQEQKNLEEETTEFKQAEVAIELEQAMEEMAPGWNLGNALDSFNPNLVVLNSSETFFGNPETTREMISLVKEQGFHCVRIPVTYMNHMDEDGTIERDWLLRVGEVVDYVINEDMYCIINMHHDAGEDGWLTADMNDLKENEKKFSNMWKQIGTYFAHYDEHLIFEGYNEILNKEAQWSQPGKESFEAANQLNQTFVDTIRSLSGENQSRILLVNTYAAGTEAEILKNFQMPKDSISNRILVGVHNFQGSDDIERVYRNLEQYMLQRDIPVVLSETAVSRQHSLSNRVEYARKLHDLSAETGIPFFWWDDGCYGPRADELCDFALLNRNTLSWTDVEVVQALTREP